MKHETHQQIKKEEKDILKHIIIPYVLDYTVCLLNKCGLQ